MAKVRLSDEREKILNLLVEMTAKGANPDETYKAIKYSLSVINAERQYLDCKQSYIDNGIAMLEGRYQD